MILETRHPAETINQPDAVETYVCKMLHTGAKQGLSLDDSDLLSRIYAGGQKDAVRVMEQIFANPAAWAVQAFVQRTRKEFEANIPFDDKLTLAIAMLQPERIGSMLMLAYWIQWWAYTEEKVKKLSFTRVMDKLLVAGVPTEEQLKIVWQLQKVTPPDAGMDNLIDYPSARRSFMPH